jgi:hypothetical protein
MTKRRVSVKGKGADIFFGDFSGAQGPAEPPSEAATGAPEPDAAAPASDMLASKKASAQESKNARTRASKKRTIQDNATPPEADPVSPMHELLGSVWQPVSERATLTNAFRYTDRDLALLEDVLYDIHKRLRLKLTKQDVARLGLNAVLLDYQTHGDASLLGRFAHRRKQQDEGRS